MPSVTLQDVLRGGRQCDEDGVEIIMSRQACVEAADEIDVLRPRVQILLGERDLAVYALQAERTLLAEERKNCDYLMGKLAEALKRAEAAEANHPPMYWHYSKPPMDGSPFLAVFSTKTGWDYYPCLFDLESATLCWYEDGGPIGYGIDEMRGWVPITAPTVV